MCLRKDHRRTPFHRVAHWNGMYWNDSWLRQAGVIVFLGHNGERCTKVDEWIKSNGPDVNVTDKSDEPPLEDPGDDSDWEHDDDTLWQAVSDCQKTEAGRYPKAIYTGSG